MQIIWVSHTKSISTTLAIVFLLLAAFCTGVSAMEGDKSNANTAEKLVTFYPTYGRQVNGDWLVPLRVWVHEEPDLKRRALAKLARPLLAHKAGVDDLKESDKELFSRHSDDFVADSESNESVRFAFDEDPEHRQFFVENSAGRSTTDLNGLVEGTLRLDIETAQRLLEAQKSTNGWLRFHAVSDDHWGVGLVRLISPEGLSVISDIDDTIKVTGIPAGESVVLRNTFFRDFVAAPCMSDLYRQFGDDIAFHYVSGGPWQMYRPLSDFMFADSVGFPLGSFHMKNLRINPFEKASYEDIWNIIASGSQQATFEQKVSQISTIMNHFPGRSFILIGDSGEKDPKVFAKIREEFPEQVREIRIRVVTDEDAGSPDRLANMIQIPAKPHTGESCSEFLTPSVRLPVVSHDPVS